MWISWNTKLVWYVRGVWAQFSDSCSKFCAHYLIISFSEKFIRLQNSDGNCKTLRKDSIHFISLAVTARSFWSWTILKSSSWLNLIEDGFFIDPIWIHKESQVRHICWLKFLSLSNILCHWVEQILNIYVIPCQC